MVDLALGSVAYSGPSALFISFIQSTYKFLFRAISRLVAPWPVRVEYKACLVDKKFGGLSFCYVCVGRGRCCANES